MENVQMVGKKRKRRVRQVSRKRTFLDDEELSRENDEEDSDSDGSDVEGAD